MSQAGVTGINSGTLPPEVPLKFTTDDENFATPAAHNLNIFGNYTSDNNTKGIQTISDGDTVTVELTNRFNVTTATNNDTPTNILTFVTGDDGVYTVEAQVQAYSSGSVAGASFKLFAGFIKNAGTLTVLEDVDKIDNSNAAGAGADASFTTSGGTLINLQVTGIAAVNFNWRAVGLYSLVS